jgi:hypothetical protein
MKKLILILLLAIPLIGVGQEKLYKDGAFIIVEKDGLEYAYNPNQTNFEMRSDRVTIRDNIKNYFNVLYYATVQDSSGTLYGSKEAVDDFLKINTTTIKLEADGAVSTNIQDQATDVIIVKFNRIEASVTLAEATQRDSYKIVVSDPTEADVGDYVVMFNPDSLRFSKAYILSIDTDTLFLDTPMDVAYPAGTFVDITTTNLAVNGSDTTKIFGLRGVSESPIGITVDITRMIFHCQTSSAVDLSTFGDIEGGLVKGLVLRKVDGRYFNIWNAKTNGDLASMGYDFDPTTATNPNQGQDGFLFRLTYAGQNKMGVVIRLGPGEDLQILVQDPLQTITLLEVIAEGHITQ